MQRVICRIVRIKFAVPQQRPTFPLFWDSPGSHLRLRKILTGPSGAQSWTCNLHNSRPACLYSSNKSAEQSGIDENKGGSQTVSDETHGDSLEKESSTFNHFESVREEMAKEGKYADEPDTQPGYWDSRSDNKDEENSEGESGMSGPELQNKLKEKWGGVASDKKGVTSEAEEGLGSGPAESSPVPPGSTENVKALED